MVPCFLWDEGKNALSSLIRVLKPKVDSVG